MTLTPEQKQAVAQWVSAGDNLSAIQKKLLEAFQVTMTYMDVRFLVDDLNLTVKDAAPRADANDVSKSPPPPPRAAGGPDDADAEAVDADADYVDDELPPAGTSTLRLTLDSVTLIPGAMASGTVVFSDGVSGKWIVDNYGRPGFTEVSQPGYRPSPADSQGFVQELSILLQQKGL